MPTVKDLVKLLDLEMEEEFHIYTNRYKKVYDYVYKFSHNGLLCSENDNWNPSIRDILGFFTGEYIIIKEPWKPKRGNSYYYITSYEKGITSCDIK